MSDNPRYVVVDDPDNERGARVIDVESGEVIATGYLRCGDLGFDAAVDGAAVRAPVHFEGVTVMPT